MCDIPSPAVSSMFSGWSRMRTSPRSSLDESTGHDRRSRVPEARASLPGVLNAVARQDYADIELIVSDNGQNGTTVRDIVAEHYPRPYRLRPTDVTVDLPTHHHQVLAKSDGELSTVLASRRRSDRRYVCLRTGSAS